MKIFTLFILYYMGQVNPDPDYKEYYSNSYDYLYDNDLFEVNSGSTPRPNMFEEGSANDIDIDKVPACKDDPDNIDCRPLKKAVTIDYLKNNDEITIQGVGVLSLNYATEDNGIHTHFYNGEDDVTASFTFSNKSLFGSIHLKDGKIKRILSLSEFQQVSSLIDVPNSVRKSESAGSHTRGRFSIANLPRDQQDLIKKGTNDEDTIVQLRVKIYYNKDAIDHFMAVEQLVEIMSYINIANEGFRRSFVPIKLILHSSEEAPKSLSDANLRNICEKKKKDLMSLGMIPDNDSCEQAVLAAFRKSKGETGRIKEQAKRVRDGADVAFLLGMVSSNSSLTCSTNSTLVGRSRS